MKKFDYILFISSVLLTLTGILETYSVSSNFSFVKPQILASLIGLLIFFIIYFILPIRFFKKSSFLLYIFSLLLLFLTLKKGISFRGTRAWLKFFGFTFQSSEFSKFSVILFLSFFIQKNIKQIGGMKLFLPIFVITSIPIIFILKQPDLGTAMFFPFIFIGFIFVAGIPVTFLIFLLTFIFSASFSFILNILKGISFLENLYLIIAGVLIIVLLYIFLRKIVYFPRGINIFILFFCFFYGLGIFSGFLTNKSLKKYQKERIISFLNPEKSVSGGYQRKQAQIAFGSGRFFGKGFKKGTQSKLGFLPQATTDFMFSTVGEEFGFFGISIVLLLYLFLILRCIKISVISSEPFTSYFSIGACLYFLFHFLVNVGMNLGFIPIAGIPLPFLSKGGSSLIVSFLMIGLLERIVKERWSY